MRNPTRLFVCALALLAWPAHPLRAQRSGEPKVSAQLSTGVARLGERVLLTIAVENAREVRITRMPEVPGLAFGDPSGPSSYQSTQILNGRRYDSFQINWRLPIRPSQEGEFSIPPIGLDVDGRALETRPLRLRVVVDLRGADLGFLCIRPSSAKVVEGEPFTLELRFGWDASTSINYADLSLPWWGALPGLVELDTGDLPSGAQRVEGVRINGESGLVVEQVESAPGEENFQVFRLVRSFLPSRPGPVEFPESFLEFAKIRENFFDTRKVASYFVRAEPFTLEVVPLPLEGQPLDYSGAVGTLAVHASADVRDVGVGESIKFTVEWTGQGNLEFFQAPDPKRIDSFHSFRVFGSTEEKRFELRRVVYDLAPLDESVREIPALPLSVFDPEQGVYRTLATDAIPIRVRPLERSATLGEDAGAKSFASDIEDIDARPLAGPSAGEDAFPGDYAVLASLVSVPLGWILLRGAVRARRGDPGAPLERRRRRARLSLTRALSRSTEPRAVLDAFTDYLAARAKDPPQAWAGRDVETWAAARGAGSAPASQAAREAARDVARVVRRLEAAVFGGGPLVPREEVLAAAERWEETTR